jgi:hypothetical protein
MSDWVYREKKRMKGLILQLCQEMDPSAHWGSSGIRRSENLIIQNKPLIQGSIYGFQVNFEILFAYRKEPHLAEIADEVMDLLVVEGYHTIDESKGFFTKSEQEYKRKKDQELYKRKYQDREKQGARRGMITSAATAQKIILALCEEYDIPAHWGGSYKGIRRLSLTIPGAIEFTILVMDCNANRVMSTDPNDVLSTNDMLSIHIEGARLHQNEFLKGQIQMHQTRDELDERLFVLENRMPEFLDALRDTLTVSGFQENRPNNFVKILGPTKRFERRRDRWASAGLTAKLLVK